MKTILFAGAILLSVTATNAATTVLNFDDLVASSSVGNYNGATFGNFVVGNGFGPSSPPNFAYLETTVGGFDFAAGFNTINFTAGVFSPTTVSVYSGLGGTGSLLGSILVTNPPASPSAFSPFSVPFSGTAMSVVVNSSSIGQFAWDDLTLGSVSAIPEPASALGTCLLLGSGILLRRRVS